MTAVLKIDLTGNYKVSHNPVRYLAGDSFLYLTGTI